MSSKPKNQPISGNDLARFSGPNTFMRLPSVNDLKGLDVAVLGIPMDIGTSWRSGTRFGPKQIRAESAMLRPCRSPISVIWRSTPFRWPKA
jgi:guanidinobutyrase